MASFPGVSGLACANSVNPLPLSLPSRSSIRDGAASWAWRRSRISDSWRSVSVQCVSNADASWGSPASSGALRICARAWTSIAWTSVRYLTSCSVRDRGHGVCLPVCGLGAVRLHRHRGEGERRLGSRGGDERLRAPRGTTVCRAALSRVTGTGEREKRLWSLRAGSTSGRSGSITTALRTKGVRNECPLEGDKRSRPLSCAYSFPRDPQEVDGRAWRPSSPR